MLILKTLMLILHISVMYCNWISSIADSDQPCDNDRKKNVNCGGKNCEPMRVPNIRKSIKSSQPHQ
uniref:Uncharacterized protein n=1 Tax=Onchocerca volvulus TaxID=6282 RepID=A0A8R1U1G3_ONCVO